MNNLDKFKFNKNCKMRVSILFMCAIHIPIFIYSVFS